MLTLAMRNAAEEKAFPKKITAQKTADCILAQALRQLFVWDEEKCFPRQPFRWCSFPRMPERFFAFLTYLAHGHLSPQS